MSILVIRNEDGAGEGSVFRSAAEIASQLASIGVEFENVKPNRNADPASALEAYGSVLAGLKERYPIRSVDVVSLSPDHPDRETLRGKFLHEHTHDDFEIRLFSTGRGLFNLHVDSTVYSILCESGDLISVPARVRHWFDMGRAPDFVAIRLFTISDGWVAAFTGEKIADRFPDFDTFVSRYT